ncbi:MAG TPA: TIGR01459 family HAD-type hydrolase [Xanthobacteraceae bacterium]|nr:TIGR01459 family HAD-type hydrolase [Xanthobacteraceae bacterium]
MTAPSFLEHCAELLCAYDLLLCDVWGVVHNGVAAYPDACEALRRAREQGGTVLLISNSPRPYESIVPQLDAVGVPRASYAGVVTSGDVTRAVVAARRGQSVFHLGPPRDLPIFAGLEARLTDAKTADYVVCSGLFDDTKETPEDYRDLLQGLKDRRLFMVCANPDVVVERGDSLVYCAGALADLYHSLGGEVLYAGKPHRPIYERALAQAETLRGGKVPLDRVLAIGDSVRTDLQGAAALGVDFLFLTSGIHAGEIGAGGDPQPEDLAKFFDRAGLMPKAAMHRLVW